MYTHFYRPQNLLGLKGVSELTSEIRVSSLMALTNFFFLTFLLSFLFFNEAYGGRDAYHHVVEINSLLPTTTCSKFASKGIKRSASMLPLFHKDGPCSPLNTNKDTTQNTPNYAQLLTQDQSRVKSINSKLSKTGSFITPEQAKLPATSGSSLGTGNYYVTLGFGKPKNDLPLIFDTGSDLTWIQCKPCAGSCYTQRDPIFDPSKSSSYSNISCSSPMCTQLTSSTGNSPRCSSTACVYGIQYGDQSYSVGLFGQETLTVSPSEVFPNFQFGCGQNNDGLFGQVAGLLGLGRDKISFVSQTASKYNKMFSYCIPSRSTGFLSFGAPSTAAKFTPLLTDSRGPSFYFLTLQGISVGGKKLPISASTFSAGGTIIDSGTVITRLAPSAYSALSTAFKQGMSKYPPAPALSILDTCFNFTGLTTVRVPKISLQFAGGANLDVTQNGILIAASMSQVCLAFAGNADAGDVTIIGNRQQQTVEVVYDVAGGKLGFGLGACS